MTSSPRLKLDSRRAFRSRVPFMPWHRSSAIVASLVVLATWAGACGVRHEKSDVEAATQETFSVNALRTLLAASDIASLETIGNEIAAAFTAKSLGTFVLAFDFEGDVSKTLWQPHVDFLAGYLKDKGVTDFSVVPLKGLLNPARPSDNEPSCAEPANAALRTVFVVSDYRSNE